MFVSVLQAGQVFYTDSAGTLNRVNSDGSGKVVLLSGLDSPNDLEVQGDKLYWTEGFASPSIRSANLDGSMATTILSTTSTRGTPWLAVTSDKIYYTAGDSTFRIGLYRCDLDGTNAELLIADMGEATDIEATDVGVYWAEQGTGGIMRSDLDGSSVTTLVTGLVGPYGIDVTFTHIYWAEWNIGFIQRSDLSGGNAENVLSILGHPFGASVLDVSGDRVFYNSANGTTTLDELFSANLDGGDTLLLDPTSANVNGIAAYPIPEPSAPILFLCAFAIRIFPRRGRR